MSALLSPRVCEQQTVGRIGAIPWYCPVHIQNVLGFFGHIHEFGNGGLHLKGHFIGGDTGIGLRVIDGEVTMPIEGGYGIDQFF